MLCKINGTVFDNNYVIDDIDPNGPISPWYWKQSHGLLISDLAGEFYMLDGTTFKNNVGY